MFIKSKILRSPHAFATRRGGVSQNPHTCSLNLAFGRGDDREIVLKNLDVFANTVGFDAKSIVSLPQIHSDKIFTVTKDWCGRGYFLCDGIDQGDGYVTRESGVTLGIKTADCVPILLEAEKNGTIIAVGAVHAGWRGTASDIAGKCVERLCSEFSADREAIRVAIGPCIHNCCYEVGEDVYRAVAEAIGSEYTDRYVTLVPQKEQKYMCDLASINRHLLMSHGILSQNIDVVDICTCCNHDLFFSHRYSQGLRGTMLNVIIMA